MNDHLISLYIDNELNLAEKIDFVEVVHGNRTFKEDAVALLNQERLLRDDLVTHMPSTKWPVQGQTWRIMPFVPWRRLLAGAVAVMLAIGLVLMNYGSGPGQGKEQRFVLYRPGAENLAIVGSFTGWNPLPMTKIGTSGYWSITLQLNPGEHHYSYLLEDGLQIADPTIPLRESDDYGGENSIIQVSTSI